MPSHLLPFLFDVGACHRNAGLQSPFHSPGDGESSARAQRVMWGGAAALCDSTVQTEEKCKGKLIMSLKPVNMVINYHFFLVEIEAKKKILEQHRLALSLPTRPKESALFWEMGFYIFSFPSGNFCILNMETVKMFKPVSRGHTLLSSSTLSWGDVFKKLLKHQGFLQWLWEAATQHTPACCCHRWNPQRLLEIYLLFPKSFSRRTYPGSSLGDQEVTMTQREFSIHWIKSQHFLLAFKDESSPSCPTFTFPLLVYSQMHSCTFPC